MILICRPIWCRIGQKTFIFICLLPPLNAFSVSPHVPLWLDIPDELPFANITIHSTHLTTQSRRQILAGFQHLYAFPKILKAKANSIRQLALLLKPLLQKAALLHDFRLATRLFISIKTHLFNQSLSYSWKHLSLSLPLKLMH